MPDIYTRLAIIYALNCLLLASWAVGVLWYGLQL